MTTNYLLEIVSSTVSKLFRLMRSLCIFAKVYHTFSVLCLVFTIDEVKNGNIQGLLLLIFLTLISKLFFCLSINLLTLWCIEQDDSRVLFRPSH